MTDQPLNDYLANLLAQANRQVGRRLDRAFSAEGVPVEQWRILAVLGDGAGRSMGELAEAVAMNHPTLTKMIDRMVSNALVYRAPDPADRRKVLIFASDRGFAVNQRLSRLARRHQAEMSQTCGDQETADLKRLLEGLIARTR